MEFEFINRIWMTRMGKSRWRKRLLLGLGFAILFLTAFQVIMEGFRTVNWIISGLLPLMLICIGLMGSERGGYITAACVVYVRNDSVIIAYPASNGQDEKKQLGGTLMIPKENIILVQYSSELASFRILWEKNEQGPLQSSEETVLYPRLEQIETMREAFTKVLGIQVVQVDATAKR